jgi:diguanylate cyclase (GGDEF)-like protein
MTPERNLLALKDTNHNRPIDPVIDLTRTTSSLMALAVRTRQTLIVSDVGAYQSRQSATNVDLPHRERYGTPSCMVTPLLRGERVLGVINVADRIDGEAFDRADREAVNHIANLVALSLETARRMSSLQSLEARDPLTGLASHRLLLERIAEALKNNRDVALMVVDLNSFSWINGNYGLPAGDSVLEQLAALLVEFCAEKENAARLGGDDFALLLPDLHLAQALGRAREFVQKLTTHQFRLGTHELKVEVTIGVAASRPGHGAAELLRDAEAALSEARRRREVIGVRA